MLINLSKFIHFKEAFKVRKNALDFITVSFDIQIIYVSSSMTFTVVTLLLSLLYYLNNCLPSSPINLENLNLKLAIPFSWISSNKLINESVNHIYVNESVSQSIINK